MGETLYENILAQHIIVSLRMELNYPSKWDRFNISLTKAKYIEKKHAFLEIKSQLHVLLCANVSVEVTIRRYDM